MAEIYKITNIVNDKFYIGCTTDSARRRFGHHVTMSRDPAKGKPLHYAIKKYGKDSFVVEIIEVCENEVVFEREKYWIATLEPQYNMTKGGDGLLGYSHTEDTKARISASNAGENHWAYGTKASEETRAKLRGPRGKLSEEECEARRVRALGNKANLGKKFSDDHKRRISESLRGHKHSEETKKKISETRKNRNKS